MKITVITVTLNKGVKLEKTIKSVLSQTHTDLEYLIIDGFSSDNTLQILEKYKTHLRFISEKDCGIYNAMNKGIKMSTGNYLLFLNAGDYFTSNVSLQLLLTNSNNEDLIYGDILVQENEKYWLKTYPDTLSINYFINDTLPHPATLIKRSLFNQIGLFDEANLIVSDWAFFTDAICKFDVDYRYVNSTTSVFVANGISYLPENAPIIFQEKRRFIKQHYPEFLNNYLQIHSEAMESNYLHKFKLKKLMSLKIAINVIKRQIKKLL